MQPRHYAFYYSSLSFALCVYSVYIMLYLSEAGFSSFEIGLFTACSGAIGIIAQLVWGAIADRVPVPKLLISIMLMLIAVSLSVNVVPESWRVYLILLVVFIQAPVLLLSETWALTKNRSLAQSFGFIRGIGSLGWGLSSLLSGTLIGWFGFEAMFPIYAVLFVIPLLVLVLVMKLSTRYTEQAHSSEIMVRETKSKRATVSGTMKVKLISSLLLLRGQFSISFFAVVLFLTFAGLCQSIFGFMPLFIQQLGGDSTFLGVYTLVMTISEIPLFIFSDRIFSRYSLRRIVQFLIAAYVLRFVLHWSSASLIVILGLSLLQAVTFPILFIIGKRLILQTVAGDQHNTAFGVLASVQSMFGIGFSVLCGWIMEVYEIRALFIVGLILCAASYIIFQGLIVRYLRNEGTL